MNKGIVTRKGPCEVRVQAPRRDLRRRRGYGPARPEGNGADASP